MARMVNIDDMLIKLVEFNHQFLKIKKDILNSKSLNASTVNLISIIGNETMTLKQITEISELDKSTISRQISLLVEDGLVQREVGEDKRFSFFELTEDAKVIYRQYQADFVEYMDDALRGWSEEEKQMFSVLIGRANYSLSTALSAEQ
jgi:DNA-binding MarR family transcriptional regulator